MNVLLLLAVAVNFQPVGQANQDFGQTIFLPQKLFQRFFVN